MTLWEQYINNHPTFLRDINLLPEDVTKKLIQRLKTERNSRVNFLSTISEYLFGDFFCKNQFMIDYNKKIDTKTPDWYLQYESNHGICEVKRVNPVLSNLVLSEIYSFIEEHCQDINAGMVWINSDASQSTLLNDSKNILHQVTQKIPDVRGFLSNTKRNNLTLHLTNPNGNDLKIYIRKTPHTHTNKRYSWSIGPDSVQYDIRRVYGNEITTKISKYKGLITEQKLNFYIGLDIHFETAITPKEIFSTYIGASCLNIDTRVESTILGKFYTESIYQYLDGIIVRHNGQFYFIANPRKRNNLNSHIKSITQEIR